MGFVVEIRELVIQYADRETEVIINLSHPGGIAAREIIIHGHYVHAPPFERREICWQSGDQSLAFAGLHLRHAAMIERQSPQKLHVEMPLAESPLGRFAYCGKCFRQNIVERSTV